MKLTHFLPALVAVLGFTAPFSADARDRNDHGRSDRGRNDRHDHHDNRGDHGRGDYRNYSYRNYSHRGYRPYYGYGGYGYGFGYPYYSRPSLGFSYYSAPASVYRGRAVGSYHSDSLAVDVQRELRRRGYYRGTIDGDIGAGSRSAIRGYQADRGLSPTGRIDSTLLRSLGIG